MPVPLKLLLTPFLFSFSFLTLDASAFQVIDDGGNKIEVEKPAERIISLSPHLTELLFVSGAEKKIIATVTGSDFPEAAKELQKIGHAGQLDFEKILSLKPDLVVGWLSGNRRENIERLKKLGLRVFLSEPKKLTDIASNIRLLGKLAGTSRTAGKAAQLYLDRLSRLKQKYINRRPVKVFYILWHQPLLTINNDHIITDVLSLCGGENLFSRQSAYTPTIGFESVLQANPEVIITAARGNEMPAWLAEWKKWQQIIAVRNNHLYWVEPDWIHRQTPRILDATDKICKYIDRAR